MIHHLFSLCVKLLEWLGETFNITYQQISVIFNLWLQGGILMISGIAPLVVYVKLHISHHSPFEPIPFGTLLLYALIYIVSFVFMLWHYRLPFNQAFDLCVNDLLSLSSFTGLSYMALNIIIFIIIFLALLSVNLFICLKLR